MVSPSKKFKTAFLFCLILLVPLCLFALQLHTHNQGRTLSTAIFEIQTTAEAREISLRIRNHLLERVNDLEVLAQVWEMHHEDDGFQHFRLIARSFIRDEQSYHAINYVDQQSIIRATVPEANEPALLGRDLKQLPGRTQMHEKVRVSGQTMASEPMVLVGTYPGFVIWKPLYDRETGSFQGFVAAAIKINDLVGSVLQEMADNSFFSTVQMDGQTIYGTGESMPGTFREAEFSAVGRTWTVRAWPKPGTAIAEIQDPISWSFTLGTLLCLLTGSLLLVTFLINRRLTAAQESLRTSRENLRITLHSIGDAVIATDTGGRITNMNPVAERLTGWRADEALGRPLPEVFAIVNALTREPAANPVEAVLQSGQIVGLANHTILIDRTGREYQIADSGAPILDQNGEIHGVVLVFRDVTEEYALQEELRQSQKLQAIGQLAGGVAHDFNNMLGGIIGAAEMLELQLEPDSRLKRFSRIILESAGRASALTEKLLAFARKKSATTTTVDLHAVLEATIELLQRTKDPRINLEMALEATRHHVDGDVSQLQNALLNIGLNAIQAMPEGGQLRIASRVIALDAAYCNTSRFKLQPGEHLEITFADTGIGIPAKDMERIFEPFFTSKAPGQGTGLGLSAVYGTVQTHQGEITVSSEPGAGSSFQLRFPLSGEMISHGQPESETPLPGSGRILLVDDEEAIRTTTASLLEKMGYQVVCAANGHEAVSVFEAEPETYDVVILDMIMPVMNGRDCFEALKRIRPDLPVILCSGFSREEDLELMLANGLSGFIRKPCQSVELSRVLRDILQPKGSEGETRAATE